MKRLAIALLLSQMLCAGAAGAQTASRKLLETEVQQGHALLLQIQRDHGATGAGCGEAAGLLALRRFAPGDAGRLELLAGPAALRQLRRTAGRFALAEVDASCGWTHLAATLPGGAASALDIEATRAQSAPVPAAAESAWPGTLGALLLALAVFALLGVAAAVRRARERAEEESAGTGLIALPQALTPAAEQLQQLRAQRESLLAEVRQAVAQVAVDTQRLQTLRGTAPRA